MVRTPLRSSKILTEMTGPKKILDLDFNWPRRPAGRRASRDLQQVGLHASGADTALTEQDPWGTPYRVTSLRNGEIRVLSYGPNQSSFAGATDIDDVYSDRPTNPVKDNIRRKNVKDLIAFGTTTGIWNRHAGLADDASFSRCRLSSSATVCS